MKRENVSKPRAGSRKAAQVVATLPVLDDGTPDIKVIDSNLQQSNHGQQSNDVNRNHPSREQLITEAAYHRAEARNFAPGHELEDWLAAEVEVNARLSGEGSAY